MSVSTDAFVLGDHVVYQPGDAFRGGQSGAWADREANRHLGIVIEFMDGRVRVWDTVEKDWWVCAAASLRLVEPSPHLVGRVS